MKWQKSTYSGGEGNCVEAARLPNGGVVVRDSKDKTGAVLPLTSTQWRAFLNAIKGGRHA